MKQHLPKYFYRCPELLDQLIDLVNKLPTGDEEKREQALVEGELERQGQIEIKYAYFHNGPTSGEIVDEWEELQHRFDREFLAVAKSANCSEAVLDFLSGINDSVDSVAYLHERPSSRYHDLYDVRDVLNELADYNAKQELRPARFETNYPSPVLLSIDQKGLIKPQISGVVRLFIDNDVYAENIRRCPVCSQIYWRSTIRSRTCGKECSNVVINREYRAGKAESINARRRDTYKSKRELEEARKKRSERNR